MSKGKTPPRGYHFFCRDCGYHTVLPSKEEWWEVKRGHKVSLYKRDHTPMGKTCLLYDLPDKSCCREDLLPYLIPLLAEKNSEEGKNA